MLYTLNLIHRNEPFENQHHQPHCYIKSNEERGGIKSQSYKKQEELPLGLAEGHGASLDIHTSNCLRWWFYTQPLLGWLQWGQF